MHLISDRIQSTSFHHLLCYQFIIWILTYLHTFDTYILHCATTSNIYVSQLKATLFSFLQQQQPVSIHV